MPDSGLSWGFHRPPSDLARQCHEAQRPGHFGVSAHSSSQTGANASLANAGSAQVAARFTDEHDSLARDADIERAPVRPPSQPARSSVLRSCSRQAPWAATSHRPLGEIIGAVSSICHSGRLIRADYPVDIMLGMVIGGSKASSRMMFGSIAALRIVGDLEPSLLRLDQGRQPLRAG